MKTEWDYTNLAKAYLKRGNYAQSAIDTMLKIARVSAGDKVCDVGAGVAHLTIMLADAGLVVNSVEPNDEMRKHGNIRTETYPNVQWFEGVGEATGQGDNSFKLVSFGSSFNVCDRLPTLVEVNRIGLSKAWFAAMWNHRNLNDPIQQKIEDIIKTQVPDYGYGVRREDQTDIINQSGLFDEVVKFSGDIVHTQMLPEVVEAWRSHATLERQAGDKFLTVVSDIEDYLNSLGVPSIDVPYTTNVWMAQLKN
jgi:ubiquinone/menaquinone biosynthesis C-methylase UbiE